MLCMTTVGSVVGWDEVARRWPRTGAVRRNGMALARFGVPLWARTTVRSGLGRCANATAGVSTATVPTTQSTAVTTCHLARLDKPA